MPKKYNHKTFESVSYKTKREIPGRLFTIKINKMLEKDNALYKKEKKLIKFFMDKKKIDNESIRVWSKIKDKIGGKEGFNKINRETKKYELLLY